MPYSPDLLTHIVNVNWAAVKQQWLLGKAPRNDANNFAHLRFVGPWTAITKSGQQFPGVATGASLRGYTVLSSGCVAAGSIIDPITETQTDMFMVVGSAGDVQMGTFDAEGNLNWQSVWQTPGGLIGAGFAGKAFFIAYAEDPDFGLRMRLAVSFDGITFQSGITPFPFADDAQYNFGGPPVYLNGIYCTTGTYFIQPNVDNFEFTSNLMWSTSRDGLSWSGTYDSATFGGIGAVCYGQYFVTAGNGMFTAAAAVNRRATTGAPGSGEPDGVLHQAGTATSNNGTDWSVTALPGAEWRNSWEEGDRGSDAIAICFVQTTDKPVEPGSSDKNKGYFVVAAITSGGAEDGPGGPGNPVCGLWVDNAKVMESPTEWFGALTAIDAELDMTKVVIK